MFQKTISNINKKEEVNHTVTGNMLNQQPSQQPLADHRNICMDHQLPKMSLVATVNVILFLG